MLYPGDRAAAALGKGWGLSKAELAVQHGRAKEMRANPTEPEKRLWRSLSNSQLSGFKFRRQAVVSRYIADFLCPQKRLVVEIDGDTHDADHDSKRDQQLRRLGYETLRFSNDDVMKNVEGVLERILDHLQKLDQPDGYAPHPNPSPEGEGLEGLARIVIGVDPPASSSGDACGIVVAGLRADQRAVILADGSVEKASPETWARAVADAARIWGADRVIAEANQGGAMVKSVLQAADISLPVRLVHASRGKVARAEPVAALYEAGRVLHAGAFPRLEDELCGLLIGGGYEGPGRSPDRADGLVYALTELMLRRKREPRVRV